MEEFIRNPRTTDEDGISLCIAKITKAITYTLVDWTTTHVCQQFDVCTLRMCLVPIRFLIWLAFGARLDLARLAQANNHLFGWSDYLSLAKF